jgi:hypothetical protein
MAHVRWKGKPTRFKSGQGPTVQLDIAGLDDGRHRLPRRSHLATADGDRRGRGVLVDDNREAGSRSHTARLPSIPLCPGAAPLLTGSGAIALRGNSATFDVGPFPLPAKTASFDGNRAGPGPVIRHFPREHRLPGV